jgi:uroporphyrinogen-III synthase
VSGRILVLRPEPGASETAARARRLGLQPEVAPLFTVRALDWEAPEPAAFGAVLLTSANAARHGGAQLRAFARLPCYAVGEATAAAAREAGFLDVRTGDGDGADAVATIERDGVRRLLHPCGRDHIPLGSSAASIERRFVYASEPVEALPARAGRALAEGAVALVHSPRAAALLARLADLAGRDRGAIRLAAISPAAGLAAGTGWSAVAAAARPRDEALLELAAQLCQNGWPQE